MSIPEHPPTASEITTGRVGLLYLGICLSAFVSFVLYTALELAGPAPQRNMNPLVAIFTPILAFLTLLAALAVEVSVFRRFRRFQRARIWLLLGFSYGGFWTCYPFISVVGSPRGSLAFGFSVALASVLLVHLLARRGVSRVVG